MKELWKFWRIPRPRKLNLPHISSCTLQKRWLYISLSLAKILDYRRLWKPKVDDDFSVTRRELSFASSFLPVSTAFFRISRIFLITAGGLATIFTRAKMTNAIYQRKRKKRKAKRDKKKNETRVVLRKTAFLSATLRFICACTRRFNCVLIMFSLYSRVTPSD